MKTRWHQHIAEPKEKKEFKDSILNSSFVLDRLKEICYNMIEEAQKSSKDDYRLSAWPFYQADKVGYTRALKEIIELLQLDPEENKTK